MSLISSAMESFHMMDKTTTLDEYGGIKVEYKEGAAIELAPEFDASTQARIAQQEGVNVRYSFFMKKKYNIKFPDVIKRDADGQIFRITSNGTDNKTPESAGLDLRKVEAEMWELPKDE